MEHFFKFKWHSISEYLSVSNRIQFVMVPLFVLFTQNVRKERGEKRKVKNSAKMHCLARLIMCVQSRPKRKEESVSLDPDHE